MWSRPELKSTGAKVACQDICKTKDKGGLAIWPLKEVNHLKLIWRMFPGDSLWGKWIRTNLLKKKSFWEVSEKTQAGSWIWRKMLKLRYVARPFHMKDVGNGRQISFWFDRWSEFGVMSELLGERGILEMGIRREATLEEALCNQRRKKRHRRPILNDIEKEMSIVKEKLSSEMEDVDLWGWKSGYKNNFSTTETWQQTQEVGSACTWGKSIWFSQASPKFAFMTWIAMHDRLATMDRISGWSQGVDSICVLCKMASETRNHLFFECSFSSLIWEQLVKGILGGSYSNKWNIIVELISAPAMEKRKSFCLRYALQVTLYTLWWERNTRRHGDSLMASQALTKLIDKSIRNKLSLVQRNKMKGMEGILQYWFGTRL